MSIIDDDKIAVLIKDNYEPCDISESDSTEYLSSIDIINQFSTIFEISKLAIADILFKEGFKLKLIGDSYMWVMKRKTQI